MERTGEQHRGSCLRKGRARGSHVLALLVLGLVGCARPAPPPDLAALYGVAAVPAEGVEITTGFSTVRIRDEGTVRTLYFVDDDGREVVESRMDLARPGFLEVPYTRCMFASYLFVPQPRRVLLVGLGAGSMVRFLQHHDPDVEVDALDIDPDIVRIAEEYFGSRPAEGVRFQVADGYQVLRTAERRWDVVFMDAFLKPSMETDSTGVPLRLKEVPFYAAVKGHLADGGVVVFNVNGHHGLEEDVMTIRDAFGPVALVRSEGSNNVIVVATKEGRLPDRLTLERHAAAADQRLDPDSLSFRDLLAGAKLRR